MEQVQKQITENIVANKENISLEADQTNEQKFCELWPQVQVGLTVLQGIVKNPIVKLVISIVYGAGNAVSQGMCGDQTAK